MGKTAQPMQFTLTGFTQDTGCRVFAYEGIGEDRVRMRFTVRADLAMSRKYGIRLQELPLMCLGILERSVVAAETGAAQKAADRKLTYSEAAMMQYSDDCVAARGAAALKRTSMRRTPKPAGAPYDPNIGGEHRPTLVKTFGQNWQMR
jgi:hypothetical protein